MKISGYLLRIISGLWLVAIYAQPFGVFIRNQFHPWPTWLNWLFELPWPPPLGTNIWPVVAGFFGTLLGFVLLQMAKNREGRGRIYER
jgi:hypothetical protein